MYPASDWPTEKPVAASLSGFLILSWTNWSNGCASRKLVRSSRCKSGPSKG